MFWPNDRFLVAITRNMQQSDPNTTSLGVYIKYKNGIYRDLLKYLDFKSPHYGLFLKIP